MIRRRTEYAFAACLLIAAGTMCTNGQAKQQEQAASELPHTLGTEMKDKPLAMNMHSRQKDDAYEPVTEN